MQMYCFFINLWFFVFFYAIDMAYNRIEIICWRVVPAIVSLHQRKINYQFNKFNNYGK